MPGLYIHIPYCERKCIYCDFYSVENRSSLDAYIRALIAEFDRYSFMVRQERFSSVYLGGGTPSLLGPGQLEKVFLSLFRFYSIVEGAEITVEANPGTLTKEKLEFYRSVGVNRLSIGIQSFHDDELRFLSRIHTVAQAEESVRSAREAGFANVSIDLMTSLPGQTPGKLRRTLERAVELNPEHISAYSLIIEESTPLHAMVQAGKVRPLPHDTDADLYEFTMEYLQTRGYEHYEVSNYARPGFRSKHNSNYWNHGVYLGFGPSAHSFRGRSRWWNVSDVDLYCRRLLGGSDAVEGEEQLTPGQLLEEAIFLGLRSDGLDLGTLAERYGYTVKDSDADLLEGWVDSGLAVRNGPHLRLTSRGYLLCDELCSQLIGRAVRDSL